MTPQIERLRDHCHRLRLYQIENELTARLEQAAKKEVSYADFLDELLATEVGAKTHKHHQMRIAMAPVTTAGLSHGSGEVRPKAPIARKTCVGPFPYIALPPGPRSH